MNLTHADVVRPAALTLALAGTLGLMGCNPTSSFTVGEIKAYVLDVPPGAAIDLSTTYGDVDIAPRGEPLPGWTQKANSTGEIKATKDQTVIIAWFRSTSSDRLEHVEFLPSVENNTLTLKPVWPDKVGRSKDAVYFAIRMPADSGEITTVTGYGDVDITLPHDSATVTTGYGDVEVNNSKGALEITTGYGDIDLEHSAGPVDLTSSYGDLDLVLADTFTGGLTISTGYGDIDLDSSSMPAGSITFKTGYGDLDLSQLSSTSSARPMTSNKRKAKISGDPAAPKWNISTGYGDIDSSLGK